MVPKFKSLTEMLGFTRALPRNANYRKMLQEDFGYTVPADAEPWQPEYFWKYLVQGQYHGIQGAELEAYAVAGAQKMKDTYKVDLRDEFRPVTVTATGQPKAARVAVPKHPTGTVVFNTSQGKYDGYVNGKVVSRAATVESVKKCLTVRYQVTEFNEVK
jgi:hypothetical protein